MKRFKTYAFWVALSGAIVILVQSLGKLFGFQIESVLIENVIMSICGVLVVLGIVTKSNDKDNNNEVDNANDDNNNINNTKDKNNDKNN